MSSAQENNSTNKNENGGEVGNGDFPAVPESGSPDWDPAVGPGV